MNNEYKNNINNQHNSINDRFKIVEKNHLKAEKESRLLQRYEESLINYKRKCNINYRIVFDDPYQNFYLFQDRLYYCPWEMEIGNSKAYDLFKFLYLPYEGMDESIDALISSLKGILKINKTLTYGDYVYQYKLRYKVNYCFLDYPERCFTIVDNNLCFIDKDSKKIAIIDNYVQEIFKAYNLPLPTYYERKKIFNSLLKQVMKTYENTKPYENPYYINYTVNVKSNSRIIRGSTNRICTKSIPMSVEYCAEKGKFIKREDLYDSKFFYNRIVVSGESLGSSESYFPKHFFKLLYTLTDGNIGTIDTLSETFAYILAARNISNRITVFYVQEKQEILAILLGILVSYTASDISFKALCDAKNIKKLINLKLAGTSLNVSIDDNLPEIEKAGTLKKIVNSKPVIAKDGFLGKKTFVNNMHLVYITNKDINLIKLSNNYDTNIIKLNTTSSDLKSLIQEFENDPTEIEWVQTKFVLHGLKRIAERDLKINSKSFQRTSEKVTTNGFTDFIDLCCEINSEVECYAEDLYKSYVEFYDKFYKGEALSRVHFVKFLKSEGKYKYYRPHHSARDNRYAFLGISVDKLKLNKLLEERNLKVLDNISLTTVESYLKAMNNLSIFN